ncbi:MAG: class I SAM-dependent methyltransferase [Salibacteraceae bacterium]
MNTLYLKTLLGNTDMYLIDLIQKGYFDELKKIADVGCGSGRNIWLLNSLGHEIVAFDKDPSYVETMRLKLNLEALEKVDCRVGELGQIGELTEKFDFVICNAVLHFATDLNHFKKMFTELVGLLERDGILFIRMVTSHVFNSILAPFNEQKKLPDGSTRFVVDQQWLMEVLIPSLNLEFVEEFKTVNVNDKRTMSTLVLKTK